MGLEAEQPSITEIELSEPTCLECKSVPPPPDIGTVFRAFNTTDKPPHNTMATSAVVMDRTLVKSSFSLALSQNSERSMRWYCCYQRDVPSEGLSRRNSQHFHIRTPPDLPDPRGRHILSKEGLSRASQRYNNSRHNDCKDVQACVYTDQLLGGIQGISSGSARAIIAKYTVTRPVETTPVRRPRVDLRPCPYRGLL